MKFAAIGAPLTALMGLMIAYVTTCKRFVGRDLVDFRAMISFVKSITTVIVGISRIERA